MSNTVLLAYDPMGALLAEAVRETVEAAGRTVETAVGSGDRDYPGLAWQTAERVADGGYHSAILICGTGLGMSITANKVRGVRAARCTDAFSVEKARRNSDANVLALGAEVTAPAMARTLVETWLHHSFDSARSVPKLAEIARLERAGAVA
ncbi:RpiB/LacA/LacB family sugar-phosphate isomerase [Kitasatospora acidiphila]|uniref:RpiB/LacA/LacB family sugar-phosphate isomerase n=1 Tax=Kitasatospora acidiphila TaxID=2567942 RepID=A0A540WHT7_9ACTN|nr:RpiB/LacA/LacB family sugar-phosphate isomerase [Kitasatospora acidiphila]TQF08014.1 RpiB/LacA/LacB family sugar-phosphate isomerase [Kitasatospora acidiphila]